MTKLFNKSEYKQRRKDLRSNPTKAEKILWEVLKGKKLEGYKFRRQYGIEDYVVDFYCARKKLSIELDGDIHEQENILEYDLRREEFIKSLGIRVLRINNEIVKRNIEEAIEIILRELRTTP